MSPQTPTTPAVTVCSPSDWELTWCPEWTYRQGNCACANGGSRPSFRKCLDYHRLSLELPLAGCPRYLGELTMFLTSDGEDSPLELTGGVRAEAPPQGSRGRSSIHIYFQSPTLSNIRFSYTLRRPCVAGVVHGGTDGKCACWDAGFQVLTSRGQTLVACCDACSDESGAQSLGFGAVTREQVCLSQCSLGLAMPGAHSIIAVCL